MQTKASLRRRDGGFTLIEIMVVIAILATLMGAGTLMIHVAQKAAAKNKTGSDMSSIAAAIMTLHGNDQLGRYPPTDVHNLSGVAGVDTKKLGAWSKNSNIGAKSLYVVFRLGNFTKPQNMDGEDKVGNPDDDKFGAMMGEMKTTDCLQYLDAWGRPFIYFNASDYKNPDKLASYVLKEGEQPVKVLPKKNDKTKEFVNSDSFQLFSVGPDGIPDTDDDIVFGQ